MFRPSPENRNSPLSILFLCLFGLSTSLFAEEVGVYGAIHGGINLARFSTSGPQENRRGLTFAGGFEIPLGDLFFLEPEIAYMERGYRLPLGTINAAGVADSFIKYDFVDIPILVKKRFGPADFSIDLMGGPYVGFALSRAAVTEASGGAVTTIDLSSTLASMDYGLVLGVGGNFAVARDSAVYLHMRYLWGLANLNATTTGSSSSASTTSLSSVGISLVLGYRVLL